MGLGGRISADRSMKSEMLILLNPPAPIPHVGRVIRMEDGPPNQSKIASAKEQAREWAQVPCRPELQPIQKVLTVLLGHIDELERQQRKGRAA